jgi:hypothetical protein
MDLNNDGKNRPCTANAGPIRNQELVEGGPAMSLAFHRAISLSKGTKDCLAATATADEVRAIRRLPHIPLNVKQPPAKCRACGMRANGELLIMSRRG